MASNGNNTGSSQDASFRRGLPMVPCPRCGASPLTWGLCENGKNAGKEFFKCCRNLRVLHTEGHIEYLRSSGIMAADPSGVSKGQIESAPAVTLPSADSLVEVLNQLRQMNEAIADIRVGLAEARMAYAGACCAARTPRMIVLSLFFVWLGCILTKFLQM